MRGGYRMIERKRERRRRRLKRKGLVREGSVERLGYERKIRRVYRT